MAGATNNRFSPRHQKDDEQEPKDDRPVFYKPFSERPIRKKKRRSVLMVSHAEFAQDLKYFDEDLAKKLSKSDVAKILKLTFKKVAMRIIKDLWKMPFPNGVGRLYMVEKQIDISRFTKDENGNFTDNALKRVLDECEMGLKRTRIKWDKYGIRMPYNRIWQFVRSKGFFRSAKYQEVKSRAETPTKKNYRGHIV